MQTKDSLENDKTASLHSLNSLLGNYWGYTSKMNKETKVAEHMDPPKEGNERSSRRRACSWEGQQKKAPWNRKPKTEGEQKILTDWFLPSLQFEALPTETTQYSPTSEPMLWSYAFIWFWIKEGEKCIQVRIQPLSMLKKSRKTSSVQGIHTQW